MATKEITAPKMDNVQAHMQDVKYKPLVHPDRRVTFKVKAPNAKKVQIEPVSGQPQNNGYNGLGNAPFDMVKDEDGVWSVTTHPAVPGFHSYWLVLDGVRVNDTATRTYGSSNMQTCAVDIPEHGVDFYDIKDVPHGHVRMQWYFSKVTNAWRRSFIYTPPGYDTDGGQRYPVLYLRHGGGEDETGWVEQGRANFILDNLIAENKARRMIIAMDWCQAPLPGGTIHKPSTPPPPAVGEVLIKEFIPMVDSNYRTIADRKHRAMAGLSMGSGQTLYFGLANLDTFSALGIFSRRPMDDEEFDIRNKFGGVLADGPALNKKLDLFWWGAGTAEEGIYFGVKKNLATLDEAGVKTVFVEFPGLSHEFQTWRKSLYDFAPRLFR
jgi:enterochelin esterase-like enzyme